MARERDLFANFERMRREMDELFGTFFERGPRRMPFPAVDIYYETRPDGRPHVIVVAELAGVEHHELELEIRDRELVLAGSRRTAAPSENRRYQQLEIEHGPFRRVVALGAEVVPDEAHATYRHGLLKVDLPLAQQAIAPKRSIPIEVDERETREP